MARALHKVQKQISKKRGGKPTALHENSRDARRLRQAGAREDKLARIASAAAKSNQIYVHRVAWIKETLGDREGPLDDSEMKQLVEAFIDRENDELSGLRAAQRPGRPKSKAEERIQLRIDAEEHEFESGFWIPELRKPDSIAELERWKDDWGGLNTLKFVRVNKAGGIKPSSFPPKGLS